MNESPYPNYPPNFKEVPTVAGLHRQCIVLEFRSNDRLNNIQKAMIQEKIEAVVNNFILHIPNLEYAEVVKEARFDLLLCEGLRLPRK